MFEILMFISLLAVIKIISQIFRIKKCPPENQLKDVVLGRHLRSSQKSDEIITHLGTCKKCREKVEGFNDNS